jgi:hypothetical protein
VATCSWNPSNTSLGSPPGLLGVCTIKGGTELIITAFATRLSPCLAAVMGDYPVAVADEEHQLRVPVCLNGLCYRSAPKTWNSQSE